MADSASDCGSTLRIGSKEYLTDATEIVFYNRRNTIIRTDCYAMKDRSALSLNQSISEPKTSVWREKSTYSERLLVKLSGPS